MNEWSPGGNYSRPGTPNQTGRSYRPQWDEPEKGTKPLMVNIRAMGENRSRSFQQHSMEDVSKTSISTVSKSKKTGNGVSDPRFKRVIPPGAQNDACVGTEVKASKPPLSPQDKEAVKFKQSVWNETEYKGSYICGDKMEIADPVKPTPESFNSELPENENTIATEPNNFDQTQDVLKAVDKLGFSHDIMVKTFSKESLSDCTVNTRNTSLASEDIVDEFPNDLSIYPSATRVRKVQNWMQDQKPKPDKKQSVITVIGQTQGQDTLSSALREIDKRRRLVKELDKYAVCKKIIETDKEKELSELLTKINSLSGTERVAYSDSKHCELNESMNNMKNSSLKGSGDNLDERPELSDYGKTEKALHKDTSPDSASPTSLKRSSLKKKSKKYYISTECPIKGKFRECFARIQYQWVLCILVILSGALCWFTFFTIQTGNYVNFDLFYPKPKPMTWYEKICMWIWEIFRPSSNYKRASSWHPY